MIDNEVPPEGREATSANLLSEWKVLDQAYGRGDRTGCARRVPGCPVRSSRGGVGGNRMLLLTPEPVPWDLLLAVTANQRDVNLACLEEVDKFNDPLESLPQRAKQKSAGGNMVAISPKNSMPRDVNPMWPSSAVRSSNVGPLVGGRVVNEE